MWESKLTLPGKTTDRGMILVRSEFVQESQKSARFQMRWENLNNRVPRMMGMCYYTLPMRFEIYRKIPHSENSFALIYQSQQVDGT